MFSLKLQNPQTYIQSGNVIFKTDERNLDLIAKRIQQASKRNSLAARKSFSAPPTNSARSSRTIPSQSVPDAEPGKLLVSFLAADPGGQARKNLRDQGFRPEELHAIGREVYIYFPNGIGKSKLPWSRTRQNSAHARHRPQLEFRQQNPDNCRSNGEFIGPQFTGEIGPISALSCRLCEL